MTTRELREMLALAIERSALDAVKYVNPLYGLLITSFAEAGLLPDDKRIDGIVLGLRDGSEFKITIACIHEPSDESLPDMDIAEQQIQSSRVGQWADKATAIEAEWLQDLNKHDLDEEV